MVAGRLGSLLLVPPRLLPPHSPTLASTRRKKLRLTGWDSASRCCSRASYASPGVGRPLPACGGSGGTTLCEGFPGSAGAGDLPAAGEAGSGGCAAATPAGLSALLSRPAPGSDSLQGGGCRPGSRRRARGGGELLTREARPKRLTSSCEESVLKVRGATSAERSAAFVGPHIFPRSAHLQNAVPIGACLLLPLPCRRRLWQHRRLDPPRQRCQVSQCRVLQWPQRRGVDRCGRQTTWGDTSGFGRARRVTWAGTAARA